MQAVSQLSLSEAPHSFGTRYFSLVCSGLLTYCSYACWHVGQLFSLYKRISISAGLWTLLAPQSINLQKKHKEPNQYFSKTTLH